MFMVLLPLTAAFCMVYNFLKDIVLKGVINMLKTLRQTAQEISFVRNDIERIERSKLTNDTERLMHLEKRKADSPVQKRIDKMRESIRHK